MKNDLNLTEEVREIFERLVDDVSSHPIDAKAGDLGRELDKKITEELAISILSRWVVLAKARSTGSMVEEFTRTYEENKAQAEGAIVAIVRIIGEVGSGRTPQAPGIGEN